MTSWHHLIREACCQDDGCFICLAVFDRYFRKFSSCSIFEKTISSLVYFSSASINDTKFLGILKNAFTFSTFPTGYRWLYGEASDWVPRIRDITINELCVDGLWGCKNCSGNLIFPNAVCNEQNFLMNTARYRQHSLYRSFLSIDTKTEFSFSGRNLLVQTMCSFCPNSFLTGHSVLEILVTDRVRSTREGYVLTRVCPSVHNRGGGGTPARSNWGVLQLAGGGAGRVPQPGSVEGVGYPSRVQMGRYPGQVHPGGGGYPGQVWRGIPWPGLIPLPTQGVPPPPVQDDRCSTW